MCSSNLPDGLFWLRLARLGIATPQPVQLCRIRHLLLALTSAMKAERRRCRQGHWTGDLNRLAGLRGAFRHLWPLRHGSVCPDPAKDAARLRHSDPVSG